MVMIFQLDAYESYSSDQLIFSSKHECYSQWYALAGCGSLLVMIFPVMRRQVPGSSVLTGPTTESLHRIRLHGSPGRDPP